MARFINHNQLLLLEHLIFRFKVSTNMSQIKPILLIRSLIILVKVRKPPSGNPTTQSALIIIKSSTPPQPAQHQQRSGIKSPILVSMTTPYRILMPAAYNNSNDPSLL
ncbi:hypothetical protein DERF_009785 [Dermatophagoides farinae]|uniref:Uncharacterized protein n=1 Tax=Dermatophagoides farinae TaxID=6954 RepID=A0A922L4C7_DERFA|nr:hypothetical protein DERF_009785 [Dermatophagoides farinae]